MIGAVSAFEFSTQDNSCTENEDFLAYYVQVFKRVSFKKLKKFETTHMGCWTVLKNINFK